MKPLICGRLIVKFEQGPIEPFALGDERSVLLLELLDAAIDFREALDGSESPSAVPMSRKAHARSISAPPRALSNFSCRKLLSIIASISLCLANILSRAACEASTSCSDRRASPLFVTGSGPHGR